METEGPLCTSLLSRLLVLFPFSVQSTCNPCGSENQGSCHQSCEFQFTSLFKIGSHSMNVTPLLWRPIETEESVLLIREPCKYTMYETSWTFKVHDAREFGDVSVKPKFLSSQGKQFTWDRAFQDCSLSLLYARLCGGFEALKVDSCLFAVSVVHDSRLYTYRLLLRRSARKLRAPRLDDIVSQPESKLPSPKRGIVNRSMRLSP